MLPVEQLTKYDLLINRLLQQNRHL
jgi:hypothetical protein